MDAISAYLSLRIREVGSCFPEKFTNTWASQINQELAELDAAIGAVCTPEQCAQIREKLKRDEEGMIL